MMTTRLQLLVERRMRELGITSVRETERRAGVPVDSLRNLLAGRTKSVHAEKVEKLAKTLKLSVAEFLGAQDSQSRQQAMQNSEVLRVRDGLEFNEKHEATGPVTALIGIEGQLSGIRVDAGSDYFIEVDDNAMAPAFGRGDIVLIRSGTPTPQARKIYLLEMPGGGMVLRRLTPRISDGTYDVACDNPDFPSEEGVPSDRLQLFGTAILTLKRL